MSSGSGPGRDPDAAGLPAASSRGSRMLGGRRAVLVSTTSTVVFFAVIVLAIVLSPGFDLIRDRFLNWVQFKRALQGTISEPSILSAFLLNVKMFLVAEVLILILAMVIAIVRGIPGPVFFPFRAVAVAYTDFFRGVPLILVIYMIGFGVPGLGLKIFSSQSDVTYGVVALVLVYSAYVAEVYRAGIDSIHESQTAAARSLGLSRWKSMRFVVLPQAVRRVIPPLLNDFIGLQKDTALISVLGPIEAARAAQIYGAANFNYTSYLVAAVLFILVTIPLTRFTDYLIRRDRRRRLAGATL